MKKFLTILSIFGVVALSGVGIVYGSGILVNTSSSAKISAGTLNQGLVGSWDLSSENTTLGADIITNGGFDTDTIWSKTQGAGSVAISGGTANYNAVDSSTWISQSLGFTGQKKFKITFSVSNYTSGAIYIGGGGSSVSGTQRTANGTYTEIIEFSSGFNGLLVVRSGGSGFVGSIDNVIVLPVNKTFIDKTPYSNKGASAKFPTFTTDRNGQSNRAMSFDGSNDYVAIDSNLATQRTSDSIGSISSWFKTSNSGTTRYLFFIGKGDSTNFASLYRSSANDLVFWLNGAGSIVLNSNDTTYNDGNWHNVVITQDGITSKMYVDGILQSDTDSGEWFDDLTGEAYASIGAAYASGYTGKWSGDIGETKLYNRALSATEVLREYEAYKPKITDTLKKGLVGEWKLEDTYTTLGNTVVTNGTFDSDTAWTKIQGIGTVGISGGSANFNATDASTYIYQNIGVAGKHKYKVTYTILNYSSGNIQVSGGGSSVVGIFRSGNGTYTEVYEPSAGFNANMLFRAGSGGFVGSIDNIIVLPVDKAFTDLTPYSYNGVSANFPTLTTDRMGNTNKAMTFNGTSDYITLANVMNYSTFSISAWIKTDKSGVAVIFDERDASADGYVFYMENDGTLAMVYGTSGVLKSSGTINDNNWHHVAVTATTGSTLQFYIDGAASGSAHSIASYGSINVATAPRIGTRNYSLAYYWEDQISEVKFYNRALSATEVTQLYYSYK